MNHTAFQREHFSQLADRWWDPKGPMQGLHTTHPVRLEFLIGHAGCLAGQRVLDVGCGGGLFSEQLAQAGAEVVGVEPNADLVEIAQQHAQQSNLSITYHTCSLAELPPSDPFDVVTCMDVLEHVDHPEALIHTAASHLRPGGLLLLSTVNRNFASFLQAIILGEYVLGCVPRGTHDYARCLQPAELGRWSEAAGLTVCGVAGIRYLPGLNLASLTRRPQALYVMAARRRPTSS